MDFVHYDLGYRSSGTVEVALDTAANVLLLDSSNFEAFRSGRQYNYFGGWVQRSPFRIGIPHASHWHLAINLGGAAGSIKTGVRVLG